MRRPLASLCLAWLVLATAASPEASGGQTVSGRRLVDADWGFSLEVPSDWRLYGEAEAALFAPGARAAARHRTRDITVTVHVERDAREPELAEPDDAIDWIRSSPGAASREDRPLGDLRGILFDRYVPDKERREHMHTRDWYLRRGTDLVVLRSRTLDREKAGPAIDAVFSGFRLTPEPGPGRDRASADARGVGWAVSGGAYHDTLVGWRVALDPDWDVEPSRLLAKDEEPPPWTGPVELPGAGRFVSFRRLREPAVRVAVRAGPRNGASPVAWRAHLESLVSRPRADAGLAPRRVRLAGVQAEAVALSPHANWSREMRHAVAVSGDRVVEVLTLHDASLGDPARRAADAFLGGFTWTAPAERPSTIPASEAVAFHDLRGGRAWSLRAGTLRLNRDGVAWRLPRTPWRIDRTEKSWVARAPTLGARFAARVEGDAGDAPDVHHARAVANAPGSTMPTDTPPGVVLSSPHHRLTSFRSGEVSRAHVLTITRGRTSVRADITTGIDDAAAAQALREVIAGFDEGTPTVPPWEPHRPGRLYDPVAGFAWKAPEDGWNPRTAPEDSGPLRWRAGAAGRDDLTLFFGAFPAPSLDGFPAVAAAWCEGSLGPFEGERTTTPGRAIRLGGREALHLAWALDAGGEAHVLLARRGGCAYTLVARSRGALAPETLALHAAGFAFLD